MRRLVVSGLLAVVGALVLAGCGSSSSTVATDPATTPSASTHATSPTHSASPIPGNVPACSKVWHSGARLPASYPGCHVGATMVTADRLSCSSGQRIVRYDNRFYAVPGGVIHHSQDLRHNRTYLHSIRVCRG